MDVLLEHRIEEIKKIKDYEGIKPSIKVFFVYIR